MLSSRSAGFVPSLAVAVFAAFPLNCDSGVQAPDRSATLSGEIVEVSEEVSFFEPRPSTEVLIWVKESPDEECGVVFFVEDDTELVVGGGAGSLDDLQAGRRVRVWTSDHAIAASCPGQGVATTVEVEGG